MCKKVAGKEMLTKLRGTLNFKVLNIEKSLSLEPEDHRYILEHKVSDFKYSWPIMGKEKAMIKF